MKKLLFFVGLLWSAIASAQFTPGQLLTAAELNNQFALYAPLAGATFTGPVTIPTINNGANATTQGFIDNSTLLATDNFVKRSILATTAAIPITNVTGGTYNFATIGTGASFAVLTSGGAISSVLTVVAGGTGYQVGDCLVMIGGNGDAILRVTGVSSGAVTTAGILYGGTGYIGSLQLSGMALPPGARSGLLSGTLTSNALFIIPAGTYLQGGRRIAFANNTTGAFTTTVKLSNGAGGSTGTGVVLPQGTANSSSTLLYTDGQNDVWPEVSLTSLGSIPLSSLQTQAANTVVGNATGSTATPTAITVTGCNGAAQALQWTNGTGFGCNSTIATSGANANITSISGLSTALSIGQGGTGATSAGGALTNLGAAPLASPTFTGIPAAPTATATTNTTQLATTAMVNSAVTGASLAGAFTTLSASGNDALFYQNANGQSINSGAQTTVTTWTKVSDRVNANFVASTGVFTAPATGYYQVSAQLVFSSAVGVVGTEYSAVIVANGVSVATGSFFQESVSTDFVAVPVSAIVSLTSGQTIVLQAFQNSGAARTLSATASFNYLSINRLP